MDKMLPNNQDSELKVLEAILYDNDKMTTALDILNANDFYNEYHKNIFSYMNLLYSQGKPIDEVSICNQVGNGDTENLTKLVGGFSYILDIKKGGTNVIDINYHAKEVKENSLKRNLIKNCELVTQKAFKSNSEFNNLVEELHTIEIQDNKKTMVNEFNFFGGTLEAIQEMANKTDKIRGLKTGLPTLDNATNGIRKDNLTIIAGRPSMGKTSFALNLMDNLANNNYKGALFELEMDIETLGIRRIAYECMIEGYKLSRGELTPREWEKVTNLANKKSKDNNIFTDVSTDIGIVDVKAKCKSLKNTVGLDFIIIDHLTLMKISKTEQRHIAIGDLTKQLKQLAKDLKIAVILLCQLNRSCEARNDKRPMLSDLRDSGNIEENADLVMFLYRDEYYNKDTEYKNTLECNIAKQRNGATGVLNFIYLANFQKVAELEWKNI